MENPRTEVKSFKQLDKYIANYFKGEIIKGKREVEDVLTDIMIPEHLRIEPSQDMKLTKEQVEKSEEYERIFAEEDKAFRRKAQLGKEP